MIRPAPVAALVSILCVCSASANASTILFFDPSQVAADVASGVTSDTIRSSGYLLPTRATSCSPAASG